MYPGRYVLLENVTKRYTGRSVHTGTPAYQYKKMSKSTRTYSTAYRAAVQGSTALARYRAVHETVQVSTGQSTTRYKAVHHHCTAITVHGGTCQYTVCICAGPQAGGPGGRPILVCFSNRCVDCTNSGFSFKSLHAQTRLFIPWRPCLPWHCPPLWHPRPPQGRLAMLRQATGFLGWWRPVRILALGRGGGGGIRRTGWVVRRGGGGGGGGAGRRVERTSGVEAALDDLGLGTSDRIRNLEDTVVVRDESAAQF
jgi:hypothetical protein